MLTIGQTRVRRYNIKLRTYRQRKKIMKKSCMDKPDALTCAIRHRRCKGCPFNEFFKPDNKDGDSTLRLYPDKQ